MSPAERPLILFAHGAGAPSTHPWMLRWTNLLASVGDVTAFDYPYAAEGRARPDPLPKLIAAHRAAIARARHSLPRPVVLIGKSMGGRVGCHVALEERVAAVVCIGYPLCGGGDRTRLRDEVLLALSTPVLFVQGTRDPLCPLDPLREVRQRMRAVNELHIVEGGDHSLLVARRALKSAGRTQDDVDQEVLGVIRDFVARHTISPGNPAKAP